MLFGIQNLVRFPTSEVGPFSVPETGTENKPCSCTAGKMFLHPTTKVGPLSVLESWSAFRPWEWFPNSEAGPLSVIGGQVLPAGRYIMLRNLHHHRHPVHIRFGSFVWFLCGGWAVVRCGVGVLAESVCVCVDGLYWLCVSTSAAHASRGFTQLSARSQ
jgi:hypothetical protein